MPDLVAVGQTTAPKAQQAIISTDSGWSFEKMACSLMITVSMRCVDDENGSKTVP